jgi:hypothetical protein
VLDDRTAAIGESRKEAYKFRMVSRAEMGKGRKTGRRNPGFITTVLNLIKNACGEVVQNITPWQPPARKLKKAATLRGEGDRLDEHESDSEPDS